MRPLLLVLFALSLPAAVLEPIPLWPGTPPGEKGGIGPERDTTTGKDNLVAGKRVARIGDVSVPTMTVYRPKAGTENGTAILVFPGGGYNILAYDLEGTEVCDWLTSKGITCALVKYRVPARAGQPRYPAPLQDAQRAIGLVRSRAREWRVNPQRVGVLGFSAGAHLSARLSTDYAQRSYEQVDAADGQPARPDFAVLIYPGGVVPRNSDQMDPNLKVDANTPPTIIVQTQDDNVRVENSLVYYNALRAAKVPVEMHLYPSGGHGYGLRRSEHLVTTWPARVEEWLASLYAKR